MKKRLALVVPNQLWHKFDLITTWNIPPRTLCQLGACVEDIVDVKIIDAQNDKMSIEEFQKEITNYNPDFVGLSVLSTEYADTLDQAARAVKKVTPDTIVIAGGVHVTTKYYDVMKNPDVDYACRGEGDYLLRELLTHLIDGGPLPTQGLVYRDGDKIISQEKATVPDLAELPPPNYELVNVDDYTHTLPRYGPGRYPETPGICLTVSRGCPYECSFCQVPMISGRKIRMHAPTQIVDELELLKEKYGIKSFVLYDDNLFAMRKQAKELLRQMVDRKLNLKWHVSSFAIFVIDDEMLDLMAAAGCIGVNVAIESGNPRVLKEIINKPIKDLYAVPKLISGIKKRGMYVLANFIIGNPGETWEEIRETINFAENCGADYVKFFIAVPLQGTDMYEMARKLNAFEQDHEADNPKLDWRFSQLKSDEWTSKDVSILRVYEWDRINFAPDRIERTAEIWGVPVDKLNQIRQDTRRALQAEAMNA